MTREEAEKNLSDLRVPRDISGRYFLIDALEALGILKLDEPKKLPQRLRDFVMDSRLAQGDAMERLGNLQDVLADCGLQITEDKSGK